MLATRGRWLVAEAIVRKDALRALMRVRALRSSSTHGRFPRRARLPSGGDEHRSEPVGGGRAVVGRSGQEGANLAESHAGVVYNQLLDDGDYYWSITLTSLIVATVGGGAGLATQSECLEILGCRSAGKAAKLAEIFAAVALAGEISLSCAILASHERHDRNRP